MTDHDLNDVYNRLGKLESSTEEVLRQMRALFKKMDDQRKDIHEVGGVAKEAVRIAQQNQKEIEKDIKPAVDDYRTLKNKGLGVLAFIGLAGGATAIGIREFLGKFIQ